MEKRRQAVEESKANRAKAAEAAGDNDVLDTLLEKLRNGDTVGRRSRRTRPSASTRAAPPLPLDLTDLDESSDAANIARDMLAQLASDGFKAAIPASPTVAAVERRRRRRAERSAARNESEPMSPTSELENLPEGSEYPLSDGPEHSRSPTEEVPPES